MPPLRKRGHPDYISVSGYVRKDLGILFKAERHKHSLTQSVALEQALELWLARDRGEFIYPLITDAPTQENR